MLNVCILIQNNKNLALIVIKQKYLNLDFGDPVDNRSSVPLVSRTRRHNLKVLRIRLQKSKPCITAGETRYRSERPWALNIGIIKFYSILPALVSSPYEGNILERDVKLYQINQSIYRIKPQKWKSWVITHVKQ